MDEQARVMAIVEWIAQSVEKYGFAKTCIPPKVVADAAVMINEYIKRHGTADGSHFAAGCMGVIIQCIENDVFKDWSKEDDAGDELEEKPTN